MAEHALTASTIWLDLLGASVTTAGGRYRGRCLEAGQGEPLVLLHGTGGHLENFSRNVAALATDHHVFALDAVWHGYGPQVPFDDGLVTTMVDQVVDFLDSKEIDVAHIEGQSMGGWTALRLALDHPDRVKSLVLVTPQGFSLGVGEDEVAYFPNEDAWRRQTECLDEPSFENVAARMRPLFAHPENLPEEVVRVRQRIFSNEATNRSLRFVTDSYMGGPGAPCRSHRVTESELARVPVPTLVYWGDQNFVPPPIGRRVAELIPNATFVNTPETGHWAQFEDAPTHDACVRAFLASVGQETVSKGTSEGRGAV